MAIPPQLSPLAHGPAAVERSARAWGGMIGAHHNAVWRHLCRAAGPTAADNLVSEVFLRALNVEAPPDPGTERAWLCSIATGLLSERAHRGPRLN